MKCPVCGKRSEVVDSRQNRHGVHRRRWCRCGNRFSTQEAVSSVDAPAALRGVRRALVEIRDALARLEKLETALATVVEEPESTDENK